MVTQLVRHMTAAAAQRAQEGIDEKARWLRTNRGFIADLILNMRNRARKHGTKREDLAVMLHGMQYDQTYFDVFDGDDRDYKVRVFFEPLIGCFNGDRKEVLVEITRALDKYFPIPDHLQREWNPVWKTVPFTPKRKGDKRTQRITLQFNWKIKKVE